MNIKKYFFILALSVLLTACGSPEDNIRSYLAKAQAHFDADDYVSAKIEALNAAQIEPKNVQANLLLSEIEEQNGKWGPAIGHLKVAVDEDPWVIDTRLKLGTFYVRARMPELAAEQAEVAMVLAPENARTRVLNAQIHILRQQMDEARKEIDLALKIDPLLVSAVRIKAMMYSNDGDLESALLLVDELIDARGLENSIMLREFRLGLLSANQKAQEFEADLKRLIEDYPAKQDYMLSLAEFYSRRNRMDDTEVIFRKLVDQNPTDIFSRTRYVRFIGSYRGYDEAKTILNEYILEFPEDLQLRLMLGGLAELVESNDEALAIYLKIAASSPTSPVGFTARNRIVRIHIGRADLDEARKLTDEILTDEETNSDALMTRAAFHYAESAYDDAVADLRVILRSNEKSGRALLLLARSHVKNDIEDLAVDAYRRLIEIAPNHKTASMELARLLAGRGNDRLAEDVLRQRLEVDPDDKQATVGLIQAQLNQGNLEAAEETALSMLEQDDATGMAEFLLGRVMQAKESGADAIAAYKLALKKNPGAIQPMQALIRTLIMEGRTDEAMDYLNAHLAKYPTHLIPKLLLGAIYANNGDTSTAKEYFEEVIAIAPGALRAYQALANLYPDEPEVRIGIYQRGLSAMPRNTVLTLLLATEYNQNHKYDAAIVLYEEGLAANSDSDPLANNLASMLLTHRSDDASYERALELTKRFRESDEPAFVDTLGWALYRNGDFLTAIPYLEIAVEGADGIPQTHFHLGMAYLAAKDLSPAKFELEKAIRLAKGGFAEIDEAREALNSIEEKIAAR